jgi:hypothetical protein
MPGAREIACAFVARIDAHDLDGLGALMTGCMARRA